MRAARREYLRNYQREWMRERRARFFAEKSCIDCGAKSSLELDHVDPKTKVDHRIWSWSEQRRLEEISKCVVRCRSCHRKKTDAQNGFGVVVHGTLTGYMSFGCRCSACKLEKSKENKRNRKR